jgi:hypothetical protein
VHYQAAALREVALVDRDGTKMMAMQCSFPRAWEYHFADAFAVAQRWAGRRRFDIVSCDQWSSQFELVAGEHLRTFFDLSHRYLLITVVPGWADHHGHEPHWLARSAQSQDFDNAVRDAFAGDCVVAELRRVLSARAGFDVPVTGVVRRSDYLGGCYWIVIDKEQAT